MPVIVFRLCDRTTGLGVTPSWQGIIPLPWASTPAPIVPPQLRPILFKLAEVHSPNGFGPSWQGILPIGRINDSAPAITVQPQSQAVAQGGTINLSVSASGSGAFSYYLYGPSGLIQYGASNSWTKNNVTIADSGKYYWTVSNDGGPTTSAIADVEVITPGSSFTTQPGGSFEGSSFEGKTFR